MKDMRKLMETVSDLEEAPVKKVVAKTKTVAKPATKYDRAFFTRTDPQQFYTKMLIDAARGGKYQEVFHVLSIVGSEDDDQIYDVTEDILMRLNPSFAKALNKQVDLIDEDTYTDWLTGLRYAGESLLSKMIRKL